MMLRPPAIPLITVDPYFSVWSDTDILTDKNTVHWTGRPMDILGTIVIDGERYRFIGTEEGLLPMKQISFDCDALSTSYVFEKCGVRIYAKFTTPLIPDDIKIMSRPVSYLKLDYVCTDGKEHSVNADIKVSERICLDYAGESCVFVKKLGNTVRMGSNRNPVLGVSGDDIRINWGYFYLTADNAKPYSQKIDGVTYAGVEFPLRTNEGALVTFAYDDIKSVEYFGEHLSSYWNKNGEGILNEIRVARRDYTKIVSRCDRLSEKLFVDATKAGGEKYAELLLLAFRQTIGAHKVAVDENGDILFISKECYSNGCAATVDVSYPSIPLFLIYNPELVKGMMRPIIRYARSDGWAFDFAPHDAGQYPKVNGQVYGGNKLEMQMPVEECGNMIIMDAAVAVAEGDCSFAMSHKDLLDCWVKYLIDNGKDPENQLCTDDFAGHLAHNCNLSLKAIMGIASYGIILGMSGDEAGKEKYISMARDMARDWAIRADNGDGSYRLAFDRPDTFSMKYNIVWDKIFGTEIMDKNVISSEVASYKKRMLPYGLPLDNRKLYTKSDWLVWTATLADDKCLFEEMVDPLWKAYNFTPSRVPMTDWYWTNTGLHKEYGSRPHSVYGALQKSFRNRTVQGGLFMKLLEYVGKMKISNQ